ncbi:MAG: ATPase [Rhodopseudomonas sp.]|nr:ATPase [Rhodopseudomonas sp.]
MNETGRIDVTRFKPKTVYVIYIASTREEVWAALTEAEFTRAYFSGFAVEVDGRVGGAYRLRAPDGSVHIQGVVVDWWPPDRFSCTWTVVGMPGFDALPPCLVTYDIEQAGDSVRLTMTESHQWDVPDAILSGGRAGWPAILSSLKSLLETGRPLSIAMAPPTEMLAAVAALKG